jgi:hypothetical protein
MSRAACGRWCASRLLALSVLAAATLAAGCAGYGPSAVRPGQTAAEVADSMGPATGRYTMPDGRTRLEYARGPMGRHTWMIDLDAQGRVVGWEQVLDERRFTQVVDGLSSDELLRLIGRPAERRHGGWQGGEVWSYRYFTNDCLWFQVSVDDNRRVKGGGTYGVDPICDAPSDPRS